MPDNKIFQKKANISLVMQSIRVNKEISRIDISRELGLDRSTITNIVTKLIDKELLMEMAQGTSLSRGGRKPVLIGINDDFGIILGLEIQVDRYRATLISINGKILWNRTGHVVRDCSLDITIKNIMKDLEPVILDERIPLIGVGIGLPGHIDPLKGEILSSSPFYTEEPLNIQSLFKVPVVIDNDANCCAWGVLESRKNSGIKHFIYAIVENHKQTVSSSREVGFGIVIGGKLHYGHNFAAGELFDQIKQSGTEKEFFLDLIDKLILFSGFLNPSHIFLGGDVEGIKDYINESSLDKNCNIEFSEFEEFEVSYGAASMFIERLFYIPEIGKNQDLSLSWEEIISLREEKGGLL